MAILLALGWAMVAPWSRQRHRRYSCRAHPGVARMKARRGPAEKCEAGPGALGWERTTRYSINEKSLFFLKSGAFYRFILFYHAAAQNE